MQLKCVSCSSEGKSGPKIVKFGSFHRRSDSCRIQRFKCERCKKTFSTARFDPCFLQKKRLKNPHVRELLCSGMSQRRIAKYQKISRVTVVRKLLFLSQQAALHSRQMNLIHVPSKIMEFDDLETFEHTKCKPLSITLATEMESRRILGFGVSQMAAKGHLSKIALKKYGPRRDTRYQARRKLFKSLVPLVDKKAKIKSDENPHYEKDVRKYFPECEYERHKGRRGSIVGQGELKKIRFDPLFSINHTCAMLRANINRLFRKTWCTTKRPDRLAAHLAIYMNYHNEELIKNKRLASLAA